VNNGRDYMVSAIAKDPPENTHFKFNALMSFSTFVATKSDPNEEWEWNDFYTYVQLKEPVKIADFNEKLVDFTNRHLNSVGSAEYKVFFEPQALKSIHLESDKPYEMEANGDGRTIRFLALVALLILFIAWANYINLATARAEERAGEVGVRKVIGAHKKQLIFQFLTEALLVNILAISLAYVLVIIMQPTMNGLVGKKLVVFQDHPWLLPLIAFSAVIGGTLLAGTYPVFVLSSFNPSRSLKAKAKSLVQNWFRKGLVTFQYTSSIILIISTLIIFRQLNFMKNTDLGFSMDQKLVIHAPSVYGDSTRTNLYAAFRNRLLTNAAILEISASSAIPGKYYYDLDNRGGIRMVGADENTTGSYTSYNIDEDYFETYGLQIIAGKDFSRESAADDHSLAINEAALKMLGFSDPNEAIGKKVRFQSDNRQ
jgi:putative ABC transport system permease protein